MGVELSAGDALVYRIEGVSHAKEEYSGEGTIRVKLDGNITKVRCESNKVLLTRVHFT